MTRSRILALSAAALVLGLLLVACAQPTPQVIEVPKEVVVEKQVVATVIVEKKVVETVIVEREVVATPEPAERNVDVPLLMEWARSGHADTTAAAFTHWDEEDPPQIPPACAACHSTYGYHDFLGLDGSTAGQVDAPAALGSTVECVACHNPATAALDRVVFPSGAEIAGLGAEARCMVCHQGRASKLAVDASIEGAGLTDDDAVSADLGFTNIHYFAAAATLYGTLAQGGYEYDGKSYDARLDHAEGYDTCTGCHNPHTLEIKVDECATCHAGVSSVADIRDIRMEGSLVDYDGDGDIDVGIYYEVQGLQKKLYEAMQAYAREMAATPIAYDTHRYPYFFVDSDGDGQLSDEEAQYANRFNAWTGRLAKAAYNYQVSLKDPGAYAHGGKYVLQLLYDSIEDLNSMLGDPIDLLGASRDDAGHFRGSATAFRYWDAAGSVPASCSRCHTGAGLPFFLQHGVDITQTPSNGLFCASCHDDLTEYTIYQVEQVKFPSGAELDTGTMQNNLCLGCHQGRESKVSVDALTAGLDDDAVSETLRFLNIHYFAAGATLFGAEAQGAYEYDGQTYAGRFAHVSSYSTCTDCHSTHRLQVKVEDCVSCHPQASEGLEAIRISTVDYDGDGDTTEGLHGEIETMRQALYAAMQDYASNEVGTGIVYSSARHPYFFIDTNDNGLADEDEINAGNRYATWTPRLLRAAYNYQYSMKDPGVAAHNGKYILQVLYDALVDLSEVVDADMAGMTRPD